MLKLSILYEDDDILVIDKPAGLLVHPTLKNETDTLTDILIRYLPNIKYVGEDSKRPGIVHRLDKDTSGLMLITKNNNAFYYFKKIFLDRKIEKRYLALVFGSVKDSQGTITKSISFSKKNRNKRSALLDSHSKKAWTEYKVIKRFSDYSLLEVAIKTGRTHQIRVHLASIGHPIVGDKQYMFKRQIAPQSLQRQFLHAHYLKFLHLSGKIIELQSKLPNDLKQILEKI